MFINPNWFVDRNDTHLQRRWPLAFGAAVDGKASFSLAASHHHRSGRV